MDIIIAFGLGMIVGHYYSGGTVNAKDGAKTAVDNYDSNSQHRKLPWCLTSHPSDDSPCICEVVYYKLKEQGLSPDSMDSKEAAKRIVNYV